MGSEEYLDLDAALGEVEENKLRVRFGGETYETPAALSAHIMLRVLRAQQEGADQLDATFVVRLLDEVWGRDVLDAVAERGVSVERLMAATGKLIEATTSRAGARMIGDDEAEIPPPVPLTGRGA